jgi:hypothetical protein
LFPFVSASSQAQEELSLARERALFRLSLFQWNRRIRLVRERARLQGVIGTFFSDVPVRETVQLREHAL